MGMVIQEPNGSQVGSKECAQQRWRRMICRVTGEIQRVGKTAANALKGWAWGRREAESQGEGAGRDEGAG